VVFCFLPFGLIFFVEMPKSISAILILLALLAACGQRQNGAVAGGSCNYYTLVYPAIILSIENFDSTECDISFLINWGKGVTDTLLYSVEHHNFLAQTELKKRGLAIGDTVCYKHYQISSGSCNPDIFKLSLERFAKAEK
jgi:hypothetical protein